MGKIFEPMLFTNSKLNITKIQGYNPLTYKNKHIHNKHPCLPVVFVREINGDGMGVIVIIIIKIHTFYFYYYYYMTY